MSYAKRNANILDRINRHAAHPSTAALRKAAENCFTIAEHFAKHRDLLERDGFFTPEGKRAKLTEALTKTFACDMRERASQSRLQRKISSGFAVKSNPCRLIAPTL